MTSLQKILMAVGFFILLTIMFPPFQDVHPAGGAQNAGYSFILLPPQGKWGLGIVNIKMLLTEWAAIVLLSGVILTAINTPRAKSPQEQADYEDVIARTDASKLELAHKYDMGEISLVEFKQQEIGLDKIVREYRTPRSGFFG